MHEGDDDRRDALPAGTVLREYTLERVLGHGGFGIVYRALHNELRLPVAIKEFLPIELAVREGSTVRPRRGADSQDFESGLRRFRDEARALVQLRANEHIVKCRDFFRGNGTAYFVMDFEEGQSLAEVLANREAEGRPFEESELLAVMMPLLEGLARVHEAGLLHRDVKPSNILIRKRDERPVLIDFGAAKQVIAKHSKSLAPYTEGYAAPEQLADAGALGAWTDIYGTGAVMWRMVAGGKPPWAPPNPIRAESRALAKIRGAKDPLPSAGELGNGRFSSRILEAIDRCLQLDERERFQGCPEVLGELKGAEVNVPAPSPPASGEDSSERINTLPSDFGPGASSSLGRESRGGRGVRGIALASLVVGFILGIGLAHWSVGPNGELTWLTREELGINRESRRSVGPDGDLPSSPQPGPSSNLPDSALDRRPGAPDPPARPGQRFRDCDVCPEMVEVPPGSFVMGSPAAEDGRDEDEWPMRQVEIGYRLAVGVYEVTFQEWEACVDSGGCDGYVPDDEGWGRERRPVVNVNWIDAQAYVDWLSTETGKEYRLLTEAEWEYAARARTQTPYHFGDEVPPRLANFGGNLGETVAVGSYPANAFGLHDVHGNVWEWVADCWYNSYDGVPRDGSGSAWTDGNCAVRVLRGGSWWSGPRAVRSAYRNFDSTDGRASRDRFTGFRVARILMS